MNVEVVQIVARSKNNVIGNNGDLPWKLSGDLQYFKSNTMDKVCIVGRKTYEGIKHLKGRHFIVITRDTKGKGIAYAEDGVIYTNCIDTAILMGKTKSITLGNDRLFVIGGGEIYRLAMDKTDTLLVTEVQLEVPGDATYEFDVSKFSLSDKTDTVVENNIAYYFAEYKKDVAK